MKCVTATLMNYTTIKSTCSLDVQLIASLFSFSHESDVVSDISDIHPVGIFAHMSEMHDMNDRMRLLLMGHRRYEHMLITMEVSSSILSLHIADID